jgi:hypothetical protein
VNKRQAIDLLRSESWTEADAKRALANVDFRLDPDELSIRRAISSFSGSELYQRQRLQAAQKAQVTKKTRELQQKDLEIQSLSSENRALSVKAQSSIVQDQELIKIYQQLKKENQELVDINLQLKKENKDLKNIMDEIRLKFAQNLPPILGLEGKELKRAILKLFKSILG